MKAAKSIEPKPRYVKVTDPDKVAAVIARGKYRPHLPHHEKNADGSVWLEVKADPESVKP